MLFCDLVGSSALASRLDPEDMSHVVHMYQDVCAGAIVRCGEYVARFMGDGVVAYFGFSQAHEDDAERETRAGLALVAKVASLRSPAESLRANIGQRCSSR